MTVDDGKPESPLPLWVRLLPDARGWTAAGVYALGWRILWMVDTNPKLLDSAPFMGLATGVLGVGGLGIILTFHFGSSSGTAKANERADKAERRADQVVAGPGTGGAP